MKKILKVIGIMIMLLIIILTYSKVYASTITLEQIVEKFNKSSIVDTYEETGGIINAVNDEKSIEVTVTADGKKEKLMFFLEGNIFSVEIDVNEDTAFVKALVGAEIIDIIGQLHGYDEGDLLATINSEEAKAYTLEKEGYKVEEIDGSKVIMKIDISKKIPLVDFSNTYIEVEDIESSKQFIAGDGFTERSKGNIYFRKDGYASEYTVLVAEKSKLTENAYKSILSILEVMFDNEKVLEYFKKNYSNISNENKEFNGFKIEVNPIKTEMEELMIPSDGKSEMVRITINKELAISSASEEDEENNSMNGNTTDIPTPTPQPTKTPSTANIGTMPNAGFELNALNILKVVLGLSLAGIIVYSIYNKRYSSK